MKKLKDVENDKMLEQLLEQKKNESEALKKLLNAFDSKKSEKIQKAKKR